MKVILIGASTSGLFTAYLLAKEGVEVEVYEKTDALGLPPRTLIVTSGIYDVLEFIPEEAIINKLRYFELFSRSRSAKLELSSPDLVLDREKFLNLLARLAQGTGSNIVLMHQFMGFARFERKIIVSLKNLETGEDRRVNTDILVGADGALSAVSCAASRDIHHPTALIQARVPLPENMSCDTAQVWFDPNQTRYFYWLIPESDRVATVGLIADDPQKAEAYLKMFLKERQLEPLEFQAAIAPLHRFKNASSVVTDRNLFFIGDAAAHVKVTTVGGVVTGLHGARALANAILNGRNYHKELRRLKLELDLHLLIRHFLNRFKDEDYDKLIALLDGRLKDILQERTRDEMRNCFLRLILTEPRLVTLGAKALLRSMFCGSNTHQLTRLDGHPFYRKGTALFLGQ